MTNTRENYRGLYVVVIITLITYLNSLLNGFVWDDNIYLLKDSAIINFRITELLFSMANGMEYVPMHSLTLALDHLLWGFNPFGFHVANLLVYLAGVVTLYFVIISMPISNVDKRKIALWTCLVFALHPMHSEPVNFISNRCHLLAFFFVLLSAYWFVKWLNSRVTLNLSLAVLFFVLSLLSKQSAVAWPILVAVVLLFYKNNNISLQQKITAAASFLIIDIIAVVLHLRNAFISSTATSENLLSYSGTLFDKILKTINIYSFYIHKFLFPSGVTLYYDDRYLYSGLSISTGLSLVLLISVLVAALYCLRRNPLITLGVVWYSVMLVPAMNLINTSPAIANRYGLVPSIGLSLVIGYLIYKLDDKYAFAKFPAVALLMVLTTITISKNFVWQSDYTLFKAAIKQNPLVNRKNYAEALWKEKKYAEALASLKEEMNLNGSYNYYYYLGKYNEENGNNRAAIEAYQSALMQNGDGYKRPHLALANAYFKSGNDLSAVKEYLNVFDAYDVDPLGLLDGEAKKNIAILQNKFLPELDSMKGKLVSDSNNGRQIAEIALFYQKIGMYHDAIVYYDKLIKVEPSNWVAWHNKALCLAKINNLKEAVAAFEQSFLLNGKNLEALNHIGSLYVKAKNYAKAEEYFKKAVLVDQAHVASVFNLARLYFGTGRKNEARKYFAMAVSLSGNSETLKNRAMLYLSEL